MDEQGRSKTTWFAQENTRSLLIFVGHLGCRPMSSPTVEDEECQFVIDTPYTPMPSFLGHHVDPPLKKEVFAMETRSAFQEYQLTEGRVFGGYAGMNRMVNRPISGFQGSPTLLAPKRAFAPPRRSLGTPGERKPHPCPSTPKLFRADCIQL